MGNIMADINAYKHRRASRLDEYQNGENWVTIRGVHVLLDKHGNVINNFKDPEHKLKNLRFVDAVSSHTEGGKKVIDAPLQRQTHEKKFNDSMDKLSTQLGGGATNKEDAQKRIGNALANLEQGAVVKTDNLAALKLGKGLYKVKGEKGNITAKQLAERIMKDVKVSEFSGDVSGMPKVKTGTNTNIIQKGSKRISHVAKNALEDLYNKYKSNKYSHEGLKKLTNEYTGSLPAGSELEISGNKFQKDKSGNWTLDHDGTSHKISATAISNILLNSMSTGYAGGTINAKVPEASSATEEKVEKAAEKIAEKKPVEAPKKKEEAPDDYPSDEEIKKMAEEFEKETEEAKPADKKDPWLEWMKEGHEKESTEKPSKPLSESMSEIAKGDGSHAEKTDKMLEYLKGLPDGTSITYEATNKYTGELYTVKGTKEGDKIKFFSKEAPLHSMASSFVKKLENGLMVGGTDEGIFAKGGSSEKPAEEKGTEEKPAESSKPTKKFATEKMNKAAAISYDKSKFTKEKKDAAIADWNSPDHAYKVLEEQGEKSMEWYNGLGKHVQSAFYKYTGDGYMSINNALRNVGTDGIDESMKRKVNGMTKALSECKLTKPTILRRGITYLTMASMFGMTQKEIKDMTSDINKLKETFMDSVGVENGFSSCGTSMGTGMSGQIDMEIYCPEGTEAIFANPWSKHKSYTPGSGEFETILQRGSAFKITDISFDGKLHVKCELVAQRMAMDSFGDDVSSKLVKAA